MENRSKFTHTPCKNEWRYKECQWNEYTSQALLEKAEKFKFHADDVLVCTFARSGTTLTQELIWQLKNASTIEKGKKYEDIDERFPFLELWNAQYGTEEKYFHILEKQEGGRLIKTHIPLHMIKNNLLEAKPKIVVVIRNPKDTAVSLYHFYRGLPMYGPWPGDWNEFCEKVFIGGLTMCGDWFRVYKDWLEERTSGELDIHLVTYEDLVKTPRKEIIAIKEFFQLEATEEQIDIVMHNCNFKTMVENDQVNYTFADTGFRFIRKGKIGDWKNHFTVSQSEYMDRVVAERLGDVKDFPKLQYE